MIDFVPIEFYSPLFYYVNLLLVLILYFRYANKPYIAVSTKLGVVIVWLVVLYMGLRPLDKGFMGDTGAYLRVFNLFRDGEATDRFEDDFGFVILMKFFAKWSDEVFFFLACSFIYVYLHYLVAKKIFQDYWYIGFIIFISSMSFWPYGTNGIRNGLASAIVLYAFTFDKKKYVAIAIALIGVSFHKTMLLPVLALSLTYFYNNPKLYIKVWLLCIPLSLVAGGAFEALFASIGFDDDRVGYLIEGNVNDDEFAYTGFRWDFLLYSASAVYTGWYFIIKKNFQDEFYQRVFNVYLIANAFWILVIKANFSNRFAYLSWFMIGLIIIYPFLKQEILTNQAKKTLLVVVLYFAFTFLFNVLLV
jgi:hypothetical protein